ncbi:Holliday junction resolvasome RuvABC endonuclease subunit [Georgenia satyanarayanai]|uniref:Holliday junction resolvasome RuvABC endonuclease subunit n=1 Tax=Georgenia satyanarayanai TaxID=860221 RepID=A0A2Y9BX90_9MICO|nr:hypothetical protein [Georgenia satyanarayanai]PYG00180.1 Holliday junction resolvasome RuvABC endonuclease subunit [Georgenia satyanarayanai]SSA40412.1 Holliday junction resolvasome RuvABC endonuclease subunit [Georgenia satyanarayanai]
MHVVGIDLSLTATGIAHAYTGGTTVDTITSKGTADATLPARAARLDRLTTTILDNLGDAQLVVLESPSLGQARQGGQLDRHGLWWLVAHALHRRGYPTATVTPAGRAKYATGKGNAPKDAVLLAVARRYPTVEVVNNNEADALVLAAMGTRHLGHPIDDMPLTHTAALDAAHWPTQEQP